MNAAEFLTLRKACGLSGVDAAKYLNALSSQITCWEKGREKVRLDAADRLRELHRLVLYVSDRLIEHHKQLFPMGWDMVVYRYKTAEQYAGSSMAQNGAPFCVQDGVIGRAVSTLIADGVPVSVEFYPEPEEVKT